MSLNAAPKYDRIQILLHWLIALMIFAMIGLGLYMVELPKKHELPPGVESVRAFYFLLHKSIGITLAMLILLRVFWRVTHKAPTLPNSISTGQKKAANGVHFVLYGLMIAMPFSGFMQSIYSKYATKFWGMELPRLAEADKGLKEQFSQVHEILAFIFITLIAIHIIAALKHRLSGNEISRRMSFKDD